MGEKHIAIKNETIVSYLVHIARAGHSPVIPEDGHQADAHRHGPPYPHEGRRHQLAHVSAVVKWVQYCHVSEPNYKFILLLLCYTLLQSSLLCHLYVFLHCDCFLNIYYRKGIKQALTLSINLFYLKHIVKTVYHFPTDITQERLRFGDLIEHVFVWLRCRYNIPEHNLMHQNCFNI